MKTQNNKENKNSAETVNKKPDVKAGLLVQCHVKISDPKSGQILLKTRG
jgi:hypothetical protein